MVLKSRWQIPIPKVDLPTYVFGSATEPLSETPYLIDVRKPDTNFLSRQSYRLWSQRVAAGLRAAGLKKGDRVLLFSGNTMFFPVVLMGVIMAGGVFTGANPTYVGRELAYQLTDSGAKFLIAGEASLPVALEATSSINMPKDRMFIFDDGLATASGQGKDVDGIRHWSALIASEAEGRQFQWDQITNEAVLKDTTIALNYSSGTTGKPKGVEITHWNYVANTAQTAHMSELQDDYEESIKKSKWICFLPMYHAMAQTIFCISAPRRGIQVYLMNKFDFIEMLQNIQRFRITDLLMVPPLLVALAKHPITKKFDLSSIESVNSGAAPLSGEVCAEAEALWPSGEVKVQQGWGMTEATCTVTTWAPNDENITGSVGELAPNCEAKFVEDDGVTEVKEGERGELLIRGPNICKGYWKKPEATRETIGPDGWLRTGDIAYANKDGKFFIVDRKKELIKVKGVQVAPAELEALLLEHSGVADAAVIGVPYNGDEAPRAYIVPQQGAKLTEKDIHDFMSTRVTHSKHLKGGVRFVESIPKNPSGKILRKILRDQVKAEAEADKAVKARL